MVWLRYISKIKMYIERSMKKRRPNQITSYSKGKRFFSCLMFIRSASVIWLVLLKKIENKERLWGDRKEEVLNKCHCSLELERQLEQKEGKLWRTDSTSIPLCVSSVHCRTVWQKKVNSICSNDLMKNDLRKKNFIPCKSPAHFQSLPVPFSLVIFICELLSFLRFFRFFGCQICNVQQRQPIASH